MKKAMICYFVENFISKYFEQYAILENLNKKIQYYKKRYDAATICIYICRNTILKNKILKKKMATSLLILNIK